MLSLDRLVQNMSFSKTSRNITFERTFLLKAQCQKTSGEWVDASLDLDTGIGNNEGHFDTSSTDYSRSAGNVKLSGTVLSADLGRTSGGPLHDSIDLDTIVANFEGVLAFQKK